MHAILVGRRAAVPTNHISAYVEVLGRRYRAPTVKQHLAAIRMLFDWLIVGQIFAGPQPGRTRPLSTTTVARRGREGVRHFCDHSSAHHDVIHANVRRKPSLKGVLDSHCKRCLALETSGSSVCMLYCRCGTNTISDVDAVNFLI